jgi:hypothetical protein
MFFMVVLPWKPLTILGTGGRAAGSTSHPMAGATCERP